MLYPQNGGRIVAVDSVTLLHPVYTTRYRPLAITVMLYKHSRRLSLLTFRAHTCM